MRIFSYSKVASSNTSSFDKKYYDFTVRRRFHTFDLTSRSSSSLRLLRSSCSLSLRSNFSFCSWVLWSWTSIRILSLESAPHAKQVPLASLRSKSWTRPRSSCKAELRAPFLRESGWTISSEELEVSMDSFEFRRVLCRSWLHKVLICW